MFRRFTLALVLSVTGCSPATMSALGDLALATAEVAAATDGHCHHHEPSDAELVAGLIVVGAEVAAVVIDD
jgi:hypothetical protein